MRAALWKVLGLWRRSIIQRPPVNVQAKPVTGQRQPWNWSATALGQATRMVQRDMTQMRTGIAHKAFSSAVLLTPAVMSKWIKQNLGSPLEREIYKLKAANLQSGKDCTSQVWPKEWLKRLRQIILARITYSQSKTWRQWHHLLNLYSSSWQYQDCSSISSLNYTALAS